MSLERSPAIDEPRPLNPASPFPGPGARAWLLIVGVALAMTLINASKPLVIDDAIYVDSAVHIAAHPLDPFGYEALWLQWREPLSWVVMGPALLYYLAAGVKLFGDGDVALKLWMFPVALLWVGSLHSLLRRWARPAAAPLLLLTAFCPLYLVNFNLMLDLPMLAVVLGSLVVFIAACDRGSICLAAAAGALAALAAQTKYSGFSAFGVIALYALVFGRWRLGVIACLLAALLFSAWEVYMDHLYGHSIFLFALGLHMPRNGSRVGTLAQELLTTVGAILPLLGLLGLWAWGATTAWLVAGGVVVAAGLGLHLGLETTTWWSLGILGLLTWLGIALGLTPLARRWRAHGRAWRGNIDFFLLLWLLVELGLYFQISPFAAGRRLMVGGIVLTLLLARAASLRLEAGGGKSPLYVLAAVSVLWGGFFFCVDRQYAVAVRDGLAEVVGNIRKVDPNARIWLLAGWSGKYYGQRLGLMEVLPDESHAQAGDWILDPTAGLYAAIVNYAPQFEDRGSAQFQGPIPLSVLDQYRMAVPLRWRTQPDLSLEVLKAREPFLFTSPYDPHRLADLVSVRNRPMPRASIPLLFRAILDDDSPAEQDALKWIIRLSGPDAIAVGLDQAAPRLRLWSVQTLSQLPPGQAARTLPALRRLADQDPDPGVRQAAQDALGKLSRGGG